MGPIVVETVLVVVVVVIVDDDEEWETMRIGAGGFLNKEFESRRTSMRSCTVITLHTSR